MNHVISADGTRIVFDKLGSGPALLIIGAGPVDRTANTRIAQLLSEDFTVYLYDRRGRGESGDTEPYATDREFEDIAAIIEDAGGSVVCYGDSGGANIGLRAAARGLNITKLGLWEPPYVLPGTREPVRADYRDRQWELRAEGRGGDMLELFMTEAVGMPQEMVAGMKAAPFWDAMGAGAACLAYDADMIDGFVVPTDLLKGVTVPTLVVDGGLSPWITAACEAVAESLPEAGRTTLPGQPHNVDQAVLAPVLAAFFRD